MSAKPTQSHTEPGPVPVATELDGKTVVVAGGTGSVGEGIVRSFLRVGARVVVPSRSPHNVERLRVLIGESLSQKLFGIEGDFSDMKSAETCAAELGVRFGRIDHAVACMANRWVAGKMLWQNGDTEWREGFLSNIEPHFFFARAFAPRVAPGGSYTLIAGMSALMVVPGISAMGMFGAALLRMRELLASELAGNVRVNDVVLGYVISRNRPEGDPEWLTADDVGRMVVRVAVDPAFDDMRITIPERKHLEEYLAKNPVAYL